MNNKLKPAIRFTLGLGTILTSIIFAIYLAFAAVDNLPWYMSVPIVSFIFAAIIGGLVAIDDE